MFGELGFHWYEDWKDGIPMFDNVQNVNEVFPDKNLIFTEGCNEGYDITKIEEVTTCRTIWKIYDK